MSILLDAVTREKNQQLGALPDAVLTPRANYPKPKSSLTSAKAVLLLAGLAATVGAAWVMAQVIANQNSGMTFQGGTEQQATAALPKIAGIDVDAQGRAPVVNEPVNHNPQIDNAQVKLAGKVALPVARAYSAGLSPQTQMAIAAEQQDEQIDEALLAGLSESEKRYAREAFTETSIDDEPIILGANANARGRAELAALKQQVDNAARQVKINDTFERFSAAETRNYNPDKPNYIGGKPPRDNESDFYNNQKLSSNLTNNLSQSQKNSQIEAIKREAEKDNLMAAFATALKDVEYEKSANQNITPEAVDPIAQTQTQDYPKFGQLPVNLQLQVPEFSVVAHVYSSVASNRWLNVDGVELQEGDKIQDKLTLIEIRPRDIVLDIQGTKFKVPAI
ncbi:general secretion pathway protein GspB [Shewanella sp.]|uniref:general secretion pathway protein GspB n=1 Tax=Shewanella sp. TaxID=50422 RepID=UPI004053A216